MEICTMDNSSSSHFFHQGIDSNEMYKTDNFETIGTNDEVYVNFDNIINQLPSSINTQQAPIPLQELQASTSNIQQYQSEIDNQQQQWKIETIECKEEIDHNDVGGDGGGNYDGNNGEYENYGNNSSFHYDYRGNVEGINNRNSFIPPQVNFNRESSNNIPNYNNSYQVSMSTTKNQPPTWYHLPAPLHQPPYHHYDSQQHPAYYSQNFYSNPLHHSYQGNYMAPTATASSSTTEHNMRNMIQMTSNRNGREARNRAEKHRRDKLNGSIQELSAMVPHVSDSPRRVDKTAVLRFSAHGLRIDYIFGGDKDNNNRYLINPKSTEGLMSLMDTFLLTITCRGNIVLVSSSIEKHLGHCRSDLYGQSLLNITHPDDHALLKQQLIPRDLHTLFAAKTDENGEIRSRTKEEEDEIDLKLREDRRDFKIRLARAGPRSEPTQYETVRIDGCFRRADLAPRGRPSTGPTGLQLIRRARGRDDNIPLHSISGNDIILIAMARVIKPPSFCDRFIEATRCEYKTRHLIDGRIVTCDQRISIVAGYMTEEVRGLSPFTFMHRDDVRWVMVALRQMYDFGRPFGESCYRLISRTGSFIYLKTRGILEIDEVTREVRSFICINTLVSDDEGRRLIKEMKRKFSAIISEAELNAMENNVVMDVENPQLLEHAILNLITNLNNQPYDDDDATSVISHVSSKYGDDKKSKAPLAIIAPNTETVKPTVSKSFEVITKVRKKKYDPVQIKEEPFSPDTCGSSPSSTSSSIIASTSAASGKKRENNFSTQNIKDEPNCSILSPLSSSYSISSRESENGSPQIHHNKFSNNNRTNEFYSNYETLPQQHSQIYDIDTQASIQNTSSDSYNSNHGTSTMMNPHKNNNHSRSSVLKRTHEDNIDDVEDYNMMLKRQMLNDLSPISQNPPLDLLATATARSDITNVLSPSTFTDDNLNDQFYNEIGTSSSSQDLAIMQNIQEEINADEQEQQEMLKSLRESNSVIQQASKRSES